MKMKKYTASTMSEAMRKVQQDFGDEAIIVSSKAIYSKGFLGFFKKKHFEIVVGIENLTMPIVGQNNVKSEQLLQVNIAQPKYVEGIHQELSSLKALLKKQQMITTQYPIIFTSIIEQMEHQELDKELVTSISDELFDIYKNSREELTKQQLIRFAKMALRQELEKFSIEGLSFNKRFINVVGPTGVGKTTTIAKMAARAVLEKRKKVGFITADTYRIGAIEQLKTYANLLQAPVEVVYSHHDYEKAIENLQHCDLIFIDTAGRNYKEEKYVNDLVELIDINEDMENYLVLAITSKQRDLEVIIEQFEDIPITKLIFTKLDETNSIGPIINLMIKYNKGLAYYTNGQEVPEDIVEATLDKVVELVFQGE